MFNKPILYKAALAGLIVAVAAAAGVTATNAKTVCYKDPAHGFVCTKVK